MTKFLAKGSLALGATLVFALPALPDTITFGFSNPTCSGSCASGVKLSNGTTTGSQVTAEDLTVNSLSIAGSPGISGSESFSLSGATLQLTGTTVVNSVTEDVFTLNGSITCFTNCGTWSGTQTGNLLTFVENISTVTSSNASTATVTYGAVTSLSVVNSTLASNIGLTSATYGAALSGTQNTATVAIPLTTNYASVTSESLAISSTPEPASFLLFGGGLMCAALVSRRRASQKA